jgi:tellurite resistance protein TehA-like permease
MQASSVNFSTGEVLEIVFALVFAVWAIYTIVVFYHWIRYGHSTKISIPALILHVIVSSALFLMAASGFA